jgi:NADPH:quinone reductase-like Zn-dependent oxidoreductase
VPGHELSGVVAALGYGTTGLTVGRRVFGPTDWTRNGPLAEYAAVEARNLAPLPADVDHTAAAALPISGLTTWQGLFGHGRLATGQTVLIHGAAGGVGSIAVQLAREVGARVIGTGRAADQDTALGLGADAFLDLQPDQLEDAGEVDVVFDVIGGDVLGRSAAVVRAGGTLGGRGRGPGAGRVARQSGLGMAWAGGQLAALVVAAPGARLAGGFLTCSVGPAGAAFVSASV